MEFFFIFLMWWCKCVTVGCGFADNNLFWNLECFRMRPFRFHRKLIGLNFIFGRHFDAHMCLCAYRNFVSCCAKICTILPRIRTHFIHTHTIHTVWRWWLIIIIIRLFRRFSIRSHLRRATERAREKERERQRNLYIWKERKKIIATYQNGLLLHRTTPPWV